MEETTINQAKIFIVDDENSNVRLVEMILEEAGYSNFHSTTDSRQARSLFDRIRPDIVLLDLAMPHLDGFAVMQQLQQANPAVPILVLTADATLTTRHRALQEGATDFLTKPLDQTEVLLRIKNLLAAHFHNVSLEEKIRERTRDLADSREQLRALATSLAHAQEAERTNIAREVHDELGQALTGLKMDLAWLEKWMVSGESTADLIQPKIRAMTSQIDATIQSVQRIATRLRPALLDDLGLESAVEWQVQEFQERADIRCECVSSLDDMALPEEQSTAVFRILQECLTNIMRHAAASRVDVLLEENNGNLMLEVQDNGCGIEAGRAFASDSLGLLGVRERASLVGGNVEITGAKGKGTTVTVNIPLGQVWPQ